MADSFNRWPDARYSPFMYILFPLYFFSVFPAVKGLALHPQSFLAPSSPSARVLHDERPEERVFDGASLGYFSDSSAESESESESISDTLDDLLYALNVMQDNYFEVWQGTWPTSIDWTAAVLGTHVSATLASLTSTPRHILADVLSSRGDDDETECQEGLLTSAMSKHALAFENLMNHFFDHISCFYFGENAFSLRNQAYDDMLWVVLGWLENIKLQELHSELHYTSSNSNVNGTAGQHQQQRRPWHGTQFRVPAAHRARLFYELASEGWDRSLCEGGMIWNPYLTPYKNAITNELFISASIGMYLYFPGDRIDSPFVGATASDEYPHDPAHLEAALEGYRWLKNSNMTGIGGLYADGFHIHGWRSSGDPGTRKCDVLNTMVYTYNQGVILSGLRGLWLATASQEYLHDGHDLVQKVIKATGWPNTFSKEWAGLGRGGVLEDACDSHGTCSQDGQTFKGIFFHHLAEFCRPLRPQEERFLETSPASPLTTNTNDRRYIFDWHQAQCRAYRSWIRHNARAALVSRDNDGKFGMWWGRPYREIDTDVVNSSSLPLGAVDYRNHEEKVVRNHWRRGPRTRRSRSSFEEAINDINDDYDDDIHEKGGRYQQTRMKGPQDPLMEQGDYNDRGRGRTVETQSGGVSVLRALYQWRTFPSLS